jgi:hypothetical protein
MQTLNEVYSSLTTRRRYEVWFVRFGLPDGAGAWWFRYLLTNPGRNGCSADSRGMPVQVWATWFPRNAKPQTFIQGYSTKDLELSGRGDSGFYFRVGKNEIKQNSCKGSLNVEGHEIVWDLEFRSTFRVTMSNKGWIGFSRTPHSNARFSGEVSLDGERVAGDPLGFGLQGHNCGYRHRGFWKWAHAYFTRPNGAATTFEALTYDMPFGLVFRKAVLWHESNRYVFRKFSETSNVEPFVWNLSCAPTRGLAVEASFDGSGPNRHRLPYVKTDCAGTFDVTNNSLAKALIRLKGPDGRVEELETASGAVLEMAGNCAGQNLLL